MLKLDSERWYERELYLPYSIQIHVYLKVLTSPVLCVPVLTNIFQPGGPDAKLIQMLAHCQL